jgi:hypothetical protein
MAAVPSGETTRQLLEAALASGMFSETQRRVVRSALAEESQREEIQIACRALAVSFETHRADAAACHREIDRFLERLKQVTFSKMDESKPPVAETMGSEAQTSPLAIQWAGNLGRVAGHEGEYSRGIPEPAYFPRADASGETMILCAEVYVPGLTDSAEPDLSLLRSQVLTELGSADGKPCAIDLDPKVQSKRAGNNLRLSWDLAPVVQAAKAGRYSYQFRFCVAGQPWVFAPTEVRHLVITERADEIPAEARVASSLLLKVGEIGPSRIGWLGTPVLRTEDNANPQALPAEAAFHEQRAGNNRAPLELAVQVWAPGVSNRADLTSEEHSLALRQLGVHVESPFFGGKDYPLRFAGKAGIHEHDDIARFNLNQYLSELAAQGGTTPPSGDYVIEIVAGERKIGTLLLHWVKEP